MAEGMSAHCCKKNILKQILNKINIGLVKQNHPQKWLFANAADDFGLLELTIVALLGLIAHGVTQRYVHINNALRVAVYTVSAHEASLDVPPVI